MIFDCKFCGGELDVTEGLSVIQCKYCRTSQTLSKTTDVGTQNIFKRANALRQRKEFDKAEAQYEKILEADDTEAEAYWGVILCKFGIEYVEDTSSGKRIPTCHRTSYDSIVADDYYKSALEYADDEQRPIYEAEAKAIDEIQKGILAISSQEKPYDVFICYKEQDSSGQRTKDSVIANDIYYQLKDEGFKVFYAAITLEDKLGSAYEPIIFAALNSSKVMLAIGTKPEYFNAVWVKNEWSRFLKMMSKDRNKMLIPCYMGMDAYDLPEEFAHLQAQDMGKIGFINDIVRGIKKVIKKESPKQATVVKETVVTSSQTAKAEPLLKRAFMFLEDGDFESADEYCEKVLDIEPENAKAYIGKLMVELKIRRQDSLAECAKPFDDKGNYQKALRFAKGEFKDTITGYIDQIYDRFERTYKEASGVMNNAKTEAEYSSAAKVFLSIKEYKDSEALAGKCNESIKELIYKKADHTMNSAKTESEYMEAAEIFKKVKAYKDSAVRARACHIAIMDITYKKAVSAMGKAKTEKEYEAAAKLFESIGKHKNAASQANKCRIAINDIIYNKALTLKKKAKKTDEYNEAARLFDSISGHRDAVVQANKCRSKKAKKEKRQACRKKFFKFLGGAFIIAIILGAIAVYNLNKKYENAVELMKLGNETEAMAVFKDIRLYRDSQKKISEYYYEKAMKMVENGEEDQAYSYFIEAGNYKDAEQKAGEIRIAKIRSRLENIEVGGYIKFGAYEQDNDKTNGKEDIEWQVLEVKDGKALVISRYALDFKKYNKKWFKDTTWEECSIRKWLNSDFVDAAFSDTEQALIPTVKVSTDENPNYSTESGKETEDKVFLLSVSEIQKYFSSNSERACEITKYALEKKSSYFFSYITSKDYQYWWLRSPGKANDYASYVKVNGDFSDLKGDSVGVKHFIRPVMWIDINALPEE